MTDGQGQGGTPAGWYDDGAGGLRWWDGSQWTEHRAPRGDDPQAGVATATQPEGEDAAAAAAAGTTPPAARPASPKGLLIRSLARPEERPVWKEFSTRGAAEQ